MSLLFNNYPIFWYLALTLVFCIGSCLYFTQRDKNLQANNNELWKGAIAKKVEKKPAKKIEDQQKVDATVYPEIERKPSTKSPAASQKAAPVKEVVVPVAKVASVEVKKAEIVSSPVKQALIKKEESVGKKQLAKSASQKEDEKKQKESPITVKVQKKKVEQEKVQQKNDPSFETVIDGKRSKKSSGKKTEERQTEKIIDKKEETPKVPLIQASNDDSWNLVGSKPQKKAKQE